MTRLIPRFFCHPEPSLFVIPNPEGEGIFYRMSFSGTAWKVMWAWELS